ncbi:MAG: hypothetical protein HeimC2_42330, partial [Candidatus Heimdallarchaeota archaeon LC_2]
FKEYYPKSRNIDPKVFLNNQNVEEQYHTYFTTQAIDRILDRRDASARVYGTKFHNRISYGLPQPYFIDNVIEGGDKYRYNNDEYLIVSELKIGDRNNPRRADFIVFKKNETNNNWKPIALFDIKTRFGYQWDLIGEINKYNEDIIKPKFRHKKVLLSDKEWINFGSMKITIDEEEQLNQYEDLIKSNYNKIRPNEECNLFKGIIRVGPSANSNEWLNYRNPILSLIRSVLANLETEEISSQMVYYDESCDNKISIVMQPILQTTHIKLHSIINKRLYCETKEFNIPELGKEATREHILYLYAESPTSAGYSAGWVATYHHLIPHVVRKYRDKRIVLIDMVNMLSKFRNERLRVSESKYFLKMLNQIEIISWPDYAIFNEIPDLDDYSKNEQKLDEQDQSNESTGSSEDGKNTVYIFAGWDFFRSMVSKQKLEFVEKEILAKVPEKATVFWIDKAPVDEDTSSLYQMRTIKFDTKRASYITKVIYNLPTAPKQSNHKNPQYESHRIILELDKLEKSDKIKEKWQSIIPLRRHSARFYGKRFESKLNKYRNIRVDKERQQIEIEKAYDLLPWLAKDRSICFPKIEYSIDTLSQTPAITAQTGINSKYSNLTYHPIERKPRKDSRIVIKELINANFLSRGKQRFDYVEKVQTIFPITTSYLVPHFNIDDLDYQERLRLRSALRLLKRHVNNYKYLTVKEKEDLAKLIKLLRNEIAAKTPCHTIKEAILFWETESNTYLWDLFTSHRNNAYKLYIRDNQNAPQEIIEEEDFFLNYGNANYLLILGLKLLHPSMDELELEKIWKELFSYSLQMIGFYPKNPNLRASNYNTTLIWNYLKTRVKLRNKRRKEIKTGHNYRYGQMETIREGSTRYVWFYLQNYHPMLIQIKYNGIFGSSDYRYHSEFDDNLLYDMKDKLGSHTEESYPVLITSFRGQDFLWKHQYSIWYLIGKFRIEYDDFFNRIKYFKITATNIKPPNPDEVEPEEISMEDVLINLKCYVRPRLYMTFGYSDQDSIPIEFYTYKQKEKHEGKMLNVEPFYNDDFDNSHLMIKYLRELKTGSVKIKDQSYQLDPINDVEWNAFGVIKSYVQSGGDIDNDKIPSNPRKFWKKFSYLQDLKEEDFKAVSFELIHDDDQCQIEKQSEDQIYRFVKLMGENKSINLRNYDSYVHDDCWKLELIDYPPNFPKSLIRNYQKNLDGKEIFFIFRDPFISIENIKTGFHDFFVFNLQLADDEICQESYWIRRLMRERFEYNLWKLPPGSSKINPTFEVESITEIDGALKMTYYNIATGFRHVKDILGDNNECLRNNNYETGLSTLSTQLGALTIVLENHNDYRYWQKIIIVHREECDSDMHEMLDDEKTIWIPKKIKLINKSNNFSLELYYEDASDSFIGKEAIANSVDKVEIIELIQFIIDILNTTRKDDFHDVIEDEFGIEVPSLAKEDQSKNRTVFIQVAGDIENLVNDEFGENSKEFISLRKALEPWE